MRRAGIKGLPHRRRPRPKHQTPTAADPVNRDFSRGEPNRLRVTDITEHPTREGKVYCAVVLATYSRKVVGWSIDATQTATLVTNALGIAIGNRQPQPGTIIHSDHGVQGGFNWSSQHWVLGAIVDVRRGLVRSTRVAIAERCIPMIRSPLPVPGDGTVRGFGGTFTDQRVAGDVRPRACFTRARGDAKRPPGPQAGDEFALEGTAALDVERLVDRLMADVHRLILRKLGSESSGDLLRTPSGSSCPVATVGFVAALPLRALRSDDRDAVRGPDRAREPLLDVLSEPIIDEQPRSSAGGLDARRATARSWPCSPTGMSWSRRCAATPARPSTGLGRAAVRSHRSGSQQPSDRRDCPVWVAGRCMTVG